MAAMDGTASRSRRRVRPADGTGGVRQGAEARALALVLLYGEPPTRRDAALRLLDQPEFVSWSTLASTVWSTDPLSLRARSLEALGVAAGHADERGTAEYNLALGERRARAARDYLVSQGIAADRISLVSFGEERPECSEHVEACWARNRRAEFLIKPK